MRARFVHDCDECQYLGAGFHMGKDVDWYICLSDSKPAVFVARYGDCGPMYHSYTWDILMTVFNHGLRSNREEC